MSWSPTTTPDTKRPPISLKDLVWTLYLWPAYWLVGILPIGLLRSSRCLVPIIDLAFKPFRKRFLRRINSYPSLADAPDRLNQIVNNYISSAFHRALDDLLLTRFPVESVVQHCEIEGREYLDQALSLNHGAILVTGHFLAIRLSKQYMKTQGWQVMSVRDFDYNDRESGSFGEKFLQKRYHVHLHRVIEDEVNARDKESVLKILERLRRGGIVNIQADASISKKRCKLPFLGKLKSFGLGFLQIARAADSPLVPMECIGDSRNLKIQFHSPLLPASYDDKTLMEILAKIMESQIVRHPEQWEYTIRI